MKLSQFTLTLLVLLLAFLSSSEQATVTSLGARRADVRLNKYIYVAVKKSGEPSVRPAGRKLSDKTSVSLTLNFLRILSFDQDTGVLKALAWLNMGWNDNNIRWDSSKFGGLNKMVLPPKRFWAPDIRLFNSRSGKTEIDNSVRAVVNKDGSMLWIPPVVTETDCDHSNETWTCEWKFGSWAYNGFELELNNSPKMDTHYFKPTGGLTVENPRATLETKYYPCCKEPYQHILFKVDIKKE